MKDSLYQKQPLVPLTQITDDNVNKLIIGEDFVDLARLGMIGEYITVEATELCPKLYYRWSYQFGVWEIYATEHDLIRYNLCGVSGIRSGGIIPPPPDVDPDDPSPGPDVDPTPDPDEDDYKVIVSSTEDEKTWTFNGAIIKFFGIIRWYRFKKGNYVPVKFKIGPNYLQYLDTLVVTYRGAKYGKEIFDSDGEVLINVSVRVPGQMVPIRFDFTDEIHAQYFIKIDKNAKFQPPDNKPDEDDKPTPPTPIPPTPTPPEPTPPDPGGDDDEGKEGDGIINTVPEITEFLEGFPEGSNMLRDECASDSDIINLF